MGSGVRCEMNPTFSEAATREERELFAKQIVLCGIEVGTLRLRQFGDSPRNFFITRIPFSLPPTTREGFYFASMKKMFYLCRKSEYEN